VHANRWITSASILAIGISFVRLSASATELCDEDSAAGDICLCNLSALHPTQLAVGMMEVHKKEEKLKDEIQRRSEQDFLKYLRRHDKIERIIIGPGGIFYVTDRHHLARALYDLGEPKTYCSVLNNLSGTKLDDFWRYMEETNQVYLKDHKGIAITPSMLPSSIKDLANDPFRSLAGELQDFCALNKDNEHTSADDYLEFRWADYLRANWAQTGIAVENIDRDFDNARKAALRLAAQKQAESLPGYTGKTFCE
jgi:hypothetical protein